MADKRKNESGDAPGVEDREEIAESRKGGTAGSKSRNRHRNARYNSPGRQVGRVRTEARREPANRRKPHKYNSV